MGREPAEEVWPQHRSDHGAVAAAGLASDASVLASGERPVLRVDPRHDLVAEVRVIPPGAGGIEELRAAQ